MTTPPNDMRWDHDHSVPHTSTASAGSSATVHRPYNAAPPPQVGHSLSAPISLASSPALSPLPEKLEFSAATLKRAASDSPDPSPAVKGTCAGKRRAYETVHPALITREGIKYPSITDVLIDLNKVFPLHAYMHYEDRLIGHCIYYAPDVATYDMDWYVDHLGMGRPAIVHLYEHAALVTERASHSD
jgi:hypothetical protein